MLVAGLDEAGRGPVLGPLVVAGVAVVDDSQLDDLEVRDSKLLSDKKRRELAPLIRSAATASTVVIVSSEALNAGWPTLNMNDQTYGAYARAIEALGARYAIVDTCGPTTTCSEAVSTRLSSPCTVVAEVDADALRRIVSAASILAKVARDDEMARLAQVHGEIGSGYPNDRKTKRWLEQWRLSNTDLPPIARSWWSTLRCEVATPARNAERPMGKRKSPKPARK